MNERIEQKIIHYCWFGGKPLNKLAKKCIKSWKKFFPDYEIKEWNESNFDVNCCNYVKQAYEQKKWAFVSDYARFKILYENGGIYFDTDVEVIKPFDKIIQKGAFMGFESDNAVATGLGCGSNPKLGFYKEVLEDYEKCEFINEDGSLNLYNVVERITDLLKKYGLKENNELQEVCDITIYPTEFFCPINMDNGKLIKTERTLSIHHYMSSWVSSKEVFRGKIYRFLNRFLGKKNADKIRKIFGNK